jgi:hypothetical protein
LGPLLRPPRIRIITGGTTTITIIIIGGVTTIGITTWFAAGIIITATAIGFGGDMTCGVAALCGRDALFLTASLS